MKINKILGTLFLLLLVVVLVSCSKKTFEVVFYDWDNTVLDTQKVEEGSDATAPKNPTREGYDFLGWNKEYTNITEDIEITATYQINTYTIVWKNHDGSVLSIDINIEWGSTPSYGGATPTKEKTAQYTYTFSNWEPAISAVNGNQEYTAQFSSTVNSYEVTFKDWDGSELKKEMVLYGAEATAPTEPTREGYEFDSWDVAFNNITGDLVVSATYQITYTIVWKNHDGSVLETDQVAYGEVPTYDDLTPTKAATTEFNYTFIGWSPTVEVATSNQEYVAQFSETIDNMTYVYYGTYPQTVVDDSSLIFSLNSLTSTNANGYYEFEGEEYAKVVAHPFGTVYGFDYKFINGSTIQSNQTYYFKVEPIKWRVLEEADGTYTLLSEYIIDKQFFYTSSDNRTIGGQTIYANNYEHSTIREWLNNAFYNKAFSSPEKGSILTTLVDNSASTTASSTNPYFSNNTMDKVYLLSYQEAISSTYGFITSTGSSSTRRAVTTDYARAVGAYMDISTIYYGNGDWWLRSPNSNYSYFAYHVYFGGYASSDIGNVYYSHYGARPAIKIG